MNDFGGIEPPEGFINANYKQPRISRLVNTQASELKIATRISRLVNTQASELKTATMKRYKKEQQEPIEL